MRSYAPVDFTKVTLSGDFWRERLETVLSRTIPSQYAKLESEGLLEALLVLDPPPPLRIPRRRNGFTTQIFWDSDIGKWIEAASYALRHRRDATIEAQIDDIVGEAREGAAPGRLPEPLVHRARDRQPLDQPARQPRALQLRPHARGRDRLLPGDRPAAGCST